MRSPSKVDDKPTSVAKVTTGSGFVHYYRNGIDEGPFKKELAHSNLETKISICSTMLRLVLKFKANPAIAIEIQDLKKQYCTELESKEKAALKNQIQEVKLITSESIEAVKTPDEFYRYFTAGFYEKEKLAKSVLPFHEQKKFYDLAQELASKHIEENGGSKKYRFYIFGPKQTFSPLKIINLDYNSVLHEKESSPENSI